MRALKREQLLPTRGVIIDPRPLDGDGFPEIGPESFPRISSEVFEARAAALRNLGVQPGDAAAPLQGCAGVMVPHPLPRESDPKRGCPSETLYPIAISLPLAGTAKLPPGTEYDGVTSRAAEGYWTVRVARGHVDPSGKSVQYYDVVMRNEGTKWIYVKAVPRVIWE